MATPEQDQIRELQELRLAALEAAQRGAAPTPPTTIPGTDIPIPGMPALEKPPLLRPPVERNGQFFKQTQMPFGDSTFEQPSDEQGLTPMDRDRQSMISSAADFQTGAKRTLEPGIENKSAGVRQMGGAVGRQLTPLAVGMLLRNPIATVAGAGGAALATGGAKAAEWAIEKGPNMGLGLGDWLKSHPESVKLGEEILALYGGGKAFNKARGMLNAAANAGPNESVQLFERVLRPGQNDYKAHEVIKEAVPVIKEFDPQFMQPSPVRVSAQRRAGPLLQAGPPAGTPLGPLSGPGVNPKAPGPGQVVQQTVSAAERAGDALMQQFDQMADPWIQRGARIDGRQVASALENAIRGDDALPRDVSDSVLQLVDYYRKTGQVPLQDAMAQLRNSNALQNAFYNKSAEGQGISLRTNAGDAAVEKARGDALREAIYSMLDSTGEGKAPAAVMKRWGNVTEFKHMVLRRVNEAYRDEPTNGRLSAIFGLGKSLYKGNTASAIENTIKVAGRSEGGIDRNLLDAFLKFEGKPQEIQMPRVATPIGLLGAGARQMPSVPDPSGPIPGAPRPGMGMSPDNGTRRLPPASTRFAGPVPQEDPSGAIQNPPRPGMGMSPSDQRRALPAPSDKVRSVTTPDPPPNSYPGQEPEQGLYRTAEGFSDPFKGLSGHQRTLVLRSLMADGKADIIVNGQKRMWTMEPGSKIKRLR